VGDSSSNWLWMGAVAQFACRDDMPIQEHSSAVVMVLWGACSTLCRAASTHQENPQRTTPGHCTRLTLSLSHRLTPAHLTHPCRHPSHPPQRQELLSSEDFALKQHQWLAEQDAVAGAEGVTASMRRTRQLLAQNVEHTAANLSVIGGAALAAGRRGRWGGGHMEQQQGATSGPCMWTESGVVCCSSSGVSGPWCQ
jgi:hypothetical protein